MLHLILEIRYAVAYPCGLDVALIVYHRYKYIKTTLSKIPTKLEVKCAKSVVCTGEQGHKKSNTQTPWILLIYVLDLASSVNLPSLTGRRGNWPCGRNALLSHRSDQPYTVKLLSTFITQFIPYCTYIWSSVLLSWSVPNLGYPHRYRFSCGVSYWAGNTRFRFRGHSPLWVLIPRSMRLTTRDLSFWEKQTYIYLQMNLDSKYICKTPRISCRIRLSSTSHVFSPAGRLPCVYAYG